MSNQTAYGSRSISAPSNPWLTPEDVVEYWTDAFQRSVLFLDVLRERGEQLCRAQCQDGAPRPEVRGPARGRRPQAAAPRQLCPGPDRSSSRRGDRREEAARSSSSTRVPGTGPGSAASRPRARSALPSRRAIPATSSASCPSPCQGRRSRTSRAPRRPSSSA